MQKLVKFFRKGIIRKVRAREGHNEVASEFGDRVGVGEGDGGKRTFCARTYARHVRKLEISHISCGRI